MLQRLALVLALVVAIASGGTQADAITNGDLDGNAHPYVGLMVAHDASGKPLWRCSGTLISSRLFLTAGHCTEAPAAHVEIWFAADMQSGTPANGYPFKGEASGTPHTHPDYDPNRFYLRDLGMVVLNKPYVTSQYGALPTLNQLDALKPSASTTFTAVGYGLQESFPDPASFQENNKRIRMVAYPKLNQINSALTGNYSLLLSNNAHTGGTCFGDSGGPNFVGNSNVIGAVTSYGINGNCAGTGGVFRVDRSWSLNWINSFGR